MRHQAFAVSIGFATAILLASAGQSHAAPADPTGYWMKPDAERESKIHVFKCGSGKKQLCATIAWLKDPNDRSGRPLQDIRNQNPSLRGRSIAGLQIFSGLTPTAAGTWTGKIYNPEDGQTYTATLTVLSRSKILLKGCKAWLLCGERHWLRTPPPEQAKPAVPVEGTEQIEASVTPAVPAKPTALAAAPNAAAEAPGLPDRAPAPPEMQAMAVSQTPVMPQPEVMAVTPASLVTEATAAPAAEYNWKRGYGFLSLPGAPDTTQQLSGENVSSLMVMAEPIETDTGAGTDEQAETTAAVPPTPVPPQKPAAKPVVATAAASGNPTPKQLAPKQAAPRPAAQAAPAPQDGDPAQANADPANAAPVHAATAEAAMAEEGPLTRRQKRLLRRQQQQAEPFLPWLR
jgi:uncharacterized protein (DUF2147 family)